jgi:hypothetical protein
VKHVATVPDHLCTNLHTSAPPSLSRWLVHVCGRQPGPVVSQTRPAMPPISRVYSFLADLRSAAISEITAGIESLTALPRVRLNDFIAIPNPETVDARFFSSHECIC